MWRAELELKFLRQTRQKCLEFVDCEFSLDAGLLLDVDDSSEHNVRLDWVDGECSGNEVGELLSEVFLEWNRELGMVSDNGIVGFSCVAPANLNHVKTVHISEAQTHPYCCKTKLTWTILQSMRFVFTFVRIVVSAFRIVLSLSIWQRIYIVVIHLITVTNVRWFWVVIVGIGGTAIVRCYIVTIGIGRRKWISTVRWGRWRWCGFIIDVGWWVANFVGQHVLFHVALLQRIIQWELTKVWVLIHIHRREIYSRSIFVGSTTSLDHINRYKTALLGDRFLYFVFVRQMNNCWVVREGKILW